MSLVVSTFGIALAVAGSIAECLGVFAMVSYRLRQFLPVQSPIPLVSFGGCCVFLGILLHVIGTSMHAAR